MPGQPAVTAPTTLFKAGCFDNDNINTLNTNLTNFNTGFTNTLANSPGIVNTVNLSAAAFGIWNTAAAVNLAAASAPAGTYRITLYLVITTTFVTNTAVVATFGWTDDQGARTLVVTGGALTAGTTMIGSQLIRSNGTAAITYTPSVTGSAATAGNASVSAILERLI